MIKEKANNLEISADDEVKYMRQAKLKMVGQIIKAYSLPAACMATGMAFIFSSHGIMKKRNGALLAAYNALDAAFQKYRERIKAEDGGLDLDRKCMFGDDAYPREADDGLDQDAICNINRRGMSMANGNPYGPYCFEFSKWTTKKWLPHARSNLNTIRAAEEFGNRQLEYFGHLFLNDMLKYLDMEEVPWGQLVGWIRGEDDGDGRVIILATEDQEALEIDNDVMKNTIFLDFNCDGVIWDRI